MTGFFKELKKYSIITIIVTAVLGVLLISKPDQMIAYTSLIIGVAVILSGVVALINYVVKKILNCRLLWELLPLFQALLYAVLTVRLFPL